MPLLPVKNVCIELVNRVQIKTLIVCVNLVTVEVSESFYTVAACCNSNAKEIVIICYEVVTLYVCGAPNRQFLSCSQ